MGKHYQGQRQGLALSLQKRTICKKDRKDQEETLRQKLTQQQRQQLDEYLQCHKLDRDCQECFQKNIFCLCQNANQCRIIKCDQLAQVECQNQISRLFLIEWFKKEVQYRKQLIQIDNSLKISNESQNKQKQKKEIKTNVNLGKTENIQQKRVKEDKIKEKQDKLKEENRIRQMIQRQSDRKYEQRVKKQHAVFDGRKQLQMQQSFLVGDNSIGQVKTSGFTTKQYWPTRIEKQMTQHIEKHRKNNRKTKAYQRYAEWKKDQARRLGDNTRLDKYCKLFKASEVAVKTVSLGK